MVKNEVIPTEGARWQRIVLALAVVIVMGRLCANEFVRMDDEMTIQANPRLSPVTVENVLYYWGHSEYALYIPVTYTVWGMLALAARVDGGNGNFVLNPWVFHAANVAVHLITALLVFEILRLLVRKDWAACLGALVYAVHPVQVETVAWASGMKDLLGGMWATAAVFCYLKTTQNPKSEIRNPKWGWYVAGLVAFMMGMLSKPGGVVVPGMLVVIDRWIMGRTWGQVARSIWPWVVLMIPCLIWTKMVQTGEQVSFVPLEYRPLVAMDALAFYAGKIAWPAQLAVDYGRFPIHAKDMGWLWWTWTIPTAMAVVLAVMWKRWRGVGVGAMIVVIGVAPVLGLVPFRFQAFSTVADHYLYLPMIGVAIAVAWVLARVERKAAMIAATVVVAALGTRAYVATAAWENNVTLFENAVRVNPDSMMGLMNLGLTRYEAGELMMTAGMRNREPLLTQVAMKQFADAENLFRRATQLVNDQPDAHYFLARSLAAQNKAPEAVTEYELALKYAPNHTKAARELKAIREAMKGK